MVSRREVIDALIDMDVDMCNILLDPEGRSEAIKRLRDYEKIIIHIMGLENELAAILGVNTDDVRNACKAAYERWKEEPK